MFEFEPNVFRQLYPEFSDPKVYSDQVLNQLATTASNLLDPCRWGALIGFGTGLWIAHRLALSALNARAAGGTPGQVNGPVTSKSVSKVSVSYDAAALNIEGGGNFNATSYGRDFLYYGDQMGAGPIQVSGGGEPESAYPGTDVFFGAFL